MGILLGCPSWYPVYGLRGKFYINRSKGVGKAGGKEAITVRLRTRRVSEVSEA